MGKRLLCLVLYLTGVGLLLFDAVDSLRGERWLPASIGPLRPLLRRAHPDVRGDFHTGDRVLEVQGRAIRRPADWYGAWEEPGRQVRVRYIHDGRTREVLVTTQPRVPTPLWAALFMIAGLLISAVVLAVVPKTPLLANLHVAAFAAMSGVVLVNKHAGFWWAPWWLEACLLFLAAGIPALLMPRLGWRYGHLLSWPLTACLAAAALVRFFADYQTALPEGVLGFLEWGANPGVLALVLSFFTWSLVFGERFKKDDAAISALSESAAK